MKPGAAILGSVSCYEDLQYLLRLRADQLEVSRETIDELGYFTAGYAGKILRARPVKRLGWVLMGDMLRALGVKLLVVEDAAGLARTLAKGKKRIKKQVRNGSMVSPAISRYLRKIAAKGGMNSHKNMTKEQIKTMMAKQWEKRKASHDGFKASGHSVARTP